MEKMLIIADDFTGALDAGVQFAVRGARTCVVTDAAYDFSGVGEDVQVFVLDAETRHLPPRAAYDTVFRAVRNARRAGFTYVYKKRILPSGATSARNCRRRWTRWKRTAWRSCRPYRK